MKKQINKIVNDHIYKEKKLMSRRHAEFSLQVDESNAENFCIPLADHLYKNYYSRDVSASHKHSPSIDIKAFIQRLKAVLGNDNMTFDQGWQVSESDPMGNVYASKGYYKNLFSAGHYLSESFTKPVNNGGIVKKAMNRYSYQEGDYFFYIHGNTPGEYINNFMVRYYFNTKAEPAIEVIKELVRALDKYQLPFEMKCPADPKNFDRKDTIVLYLNKRYHHLVMEVLSSIYPGLLDHLESDVPLFTKKLFPGIGFGESPPKNSTSFGMSRCDIIAQSIFNSILNEIPQSNWTESFIDDIRKQGFDPEQFYLNPFNSFPYDFNDK